MMAATMVHAVAARLPALREISLEEMLVWAYRDQRVDRMVGAQLFQVESEVEGCSWGRSSADGVAAVQRIAVLGCRTDGGAVRGVGHAAHPDAELLHDYAAAWPILVHFARQGERPEPAAAPSPWPTAPEAGDRYAVATVDGRPMRIKLAVAERHAVRRERATGRGRHRQVVGTELVTEDVLYCPIDWRPGLDWAEWMATEHRQWHAAIEALYRRLRVVRWRSHALVGALRP